MKPTTRMIIGAVAGIAIVGIFALVASQQNAEVDAANEITKQNNRMIFQEMDNMLDDQPDSEMETEYRQCVALANDYDEVLYSETRQQCIFEYNQAANEYNASIGIITTYQER